MVKLRFWKVRSKWDWLAFPSLLQWPALAFAFVTAIAGLKDVSVAAFMAVFALNALSLLAILAVAMGSKHHEHMSPGIGYNLATILFAPVIGVHYLWRTGQQ